MKYPYDLVATGLRTSSWEGYQVYMFEQQHKIVRWVQFPSSWIEIHMVYTFALNNSKVWIANVICLLLYISSNIVGSLSITILHQVYMIWRHPHSKRADLLFM